jgi:hypothetical protein
LIARLFLTIDEASWNLRDGWDTIRCRRNFIVFIILSIFELDISIVILFFQVFRVAVRFR